MVIDIDPDEEGGGEEEGEEGEEFRHFAEGERGIEVNTQDVVSEENHYWLRVDGRSPYRYRGGVWVTCHHYFFFIYVVVVNPNQHVHPFLPPQPSSPEHTFGNVAVSTVANESVDNGDSSSSNSVRVASFLLHLAILRRGMGLC